MRGDYILKKMFLLPVFFIVLFFALISFGTSASASISTTDNSDEYTENLMGLNVVIPYKKSEVSMEKVEEPLKEKLFIYDKETNELLKTFTVKEEIPLSTQEVSAQDTFLTVSESRIDNDLESTLSARLVIEGSGSFRQINEVRDTFWQTSSGNHQLVNRTSDAISTTGSFPTTEIEVTGAATIEVETTYEASAGFEAAGFSVSGGTGGSYFARKDIAEGFTERTY